MLSYGLRFLIDIMYQKTKKIELSNSVIQNLTYSYMLIEIYSQSSQIPLTDCSTLTISSDGNLEQQRTTLF